MLIKMGNVLDAVSLLFVVEGKDIEIRSCSKIGY